LIVPVLATFVAVACAALLPDARGAAEGIAIQEVAAGDRHTCALTANGAVWCWGENESGQLGTGTTADSAIPVAVPSLTSGVAAISAGGAHTCALTTQGAARCWGDNSSGQLGDGTMSQRNSPVGVSGLSSGVVAVSAGDAHSCALTASGVSCWGDNSSGQLGDGQACGEACHTPAQVSSLADASAISAGGAHTCALIGEDGVSCWGSNSAGQLGDDQACGLLCTGAVSVSGLSDGVSSISAGVAHTCAVMAAGGAKCWGDNQPGQLGDGTTFERHVPVDVSGLTSGVTANGAGDSHTCALTANQTLCWGDNFFSQLGDGTSADRPIPGPVEDLDESAALSVGNFHTCVRSQDDALKCWGDNAYGELGDGTTTNRAIPVDVSLLSVKRGDVNCDGTVGSVDAAVVLQLSAGLIDDLPCPGVADTTRDGLVDSRDATLILQFAAGLISNL